MHGLAAVAALAAIGAAWGLAVPLTRIAVSTGHDAFGLVLWQLIIMAASLALVLRLMRLPIPGLRGRLGLYAAVAGLGTLVPGYFAFLTAAHLPAGVRSILLASVPMFVLPLAIAAGFERPDPRRALGVLLGGIAIAIIALPGAGASARITAGMILLTLISPLCYALENVYLAWRGAAGLHPVQTLFAASVLGTLVAAPMVLLTGQGVSLRGAGAAEAAILAAGLLHALAYVGYVWLIDRAGAVFSSQISYAVTGFGVAWSWALLGERYSPWVWAGFAAMLAGILLIRPGPSRVEST